MSDWWASPGIDVVLRVGCPCDHPHSQPTCPWLTERCGVEGCRYEITDQDGCGLAKLMTVEQVMEGWDVGSPTCRLCLAAQRGESFDLTKPAAKEQA